jgi:hypothetical protein
MKRPAPGEYAPYFDRYISLTRGADVIQNLEDSTLDLTDLLIDVPLDKQDYAYAPGKWSINQMLRHIIDTDLVFTYRALNLLRNEGGQLPGFDHNLWADNSLKQDLALPRLLDEFRNFRKFALLFFGSISDEDQWNIRGKISDREFSVRSIPFILSGHSLHHTQILRERYL